MSDNEPECVRCGDLATHAKTHKPFFPDARDIPFCNEHAPDDANKL